MPRLVRLDGVRGLLAVYVMCSHALPFTNLPGWLCVLFSHGEAAVDLFFCLSGLVVMISLERFEHRFSPFIIARARRVLPVYLPVLGLAILLLPADPTPYLPWLPPASLSFWQGGIPRPFAAQLLAHVLLLHGALPQGVLPWGYLAFLAPAWSLSTEWQFYVLLGALAPRQVGGLAIALLGLGALWHVVQLPPWWSFSRAFLLDAAPFFALGLASVPYLRDGDGRLLLACLAGAVLALWPEGLERAAVPLGWGGLMLAQRGQWGRGLEHPALRWLGGISYPLYLVHEPMQRGLARLIAPWCGQAPGLFTFIWLPLALIVPLLAALCLHVAIEQPFQAPRRTAQTAP